MMLTDAWNLNSPNFLPTASSPLISGAAFTSPKLQDPYFDQVTFRGAFGTTDWTAGWTNWDPQNQNYMVGISEVDNSFVVVSNVYPNPAKDLTSVSITINSKSGLQINMFDVSGKLIKKITNELFSPGYYSFEIDMKDLDSGVYILKISSDNNLKTSRIIKI
ncbi:MAG: T9SS type A sorting domain-containing protein [Nitrosopumilus sp.]|nr:T9SS type A sorting domain-containing protein [Nitrosopumilus sp.]